MALVNMWRENRDGIRDKSLRQILAFAGEGKLADNNTCSSEFRELLTVAPLELLRKYAAEALSEDFPDAGFALQDITNELGSRLGFKVQRGLYRGRQGVSGHDGLWSDPDTSHSVVIEVKRSSTYTIHLETIARYRSDLIQNSKISEDKSSALFVVCQKDEDTNALEAQIRGSRHAWDIRLISLEALFKLVQLKNETDNPASARLLRLVLVPREYTKLDSLLEIVSFVAQDVSAEEEDEIEKDDKGSKTDGAYVSKLNRTDLRTKAKEFFLNKLRQDTKDISRTLLETQDGRIAICYAPSQAYLKVNYTQYWFGLHDHQIEFMNKHSEGFAAYLCSKAGMLFMPWSEFTNHVGQMLESSKENRHWRHVILQHGKDGKLRMRLRADAPNNPVDVTKWFVAL